MIASRILRNNSVNSYFSFALCSNVARASRVNRARRNPSAAIRFYSDAVHDHFSKPRNVGSFDGKEPNVGTSIVGKASCGDVIKLQIKVENDVIKDVRFKAFGCGSAIASSSLASELIKGKTCDEALNVKNIDIANELNLPPVKLHCSLLAEDAVKFAIQDFKNKMAPKTEEVILD